MYSPYSHNSEYKAYVQRLTEEYRAGQAMERQVMRQFSNLANGAKNMLNQVERYLSGGSSNRPMQLDPS